LQRELLLAGPPTLAPGAGKAFVTVDRLLDHARTGPWYRRQPEIAPLVIDALRFGQDLSG